MKEEDEEEAFVVKSYFKADLAHMYLPNLPLVYAMRKFRYWIRSNKELYALIFQAGEGKNDHSYSRRQVRLIIQYLDIP